MTTNIPTILPADWPVCPSCGGPVSAVKGTENKDYPTARQFCSNECIETHKVRKREQATADYLAQHDGEWPECSCGEPVGVNRATGLPRVRCSDECPALIEELNRKARERHARAEEQAHTEHRIRDRFAAGEWPVCIQCRKNPRAVCAMSPGYTATPIAARAAQLRERAKHDDTLVYWFCSVACRNAYLDYFRYPVLLEEVDR